MCVLCVCMPELFELAGRTLFLRWAELLGRAMCYNVRVEEQQLRGAAHAMPEVQYWEQYKQVQQGLTHLVQCRSTTLRTREGACEWSSKEEHTLWNAPHTFGNPTM